MCLGECFSLCARKPSGLGLVAFVLGYVLFSWGVSSRPLPDPPHPTPSPQALSLGVLLPCQGAAFLTFSLLFSFSHTFIPFSSSRSPSMGHCLGLLR